MTDRATKASLLALKGVRRAGGTAVLNIWLFMAVIAALATPLTGLALHEWFGLLAAVLLLVHVAQQWPWFALTLRRCGRDGGARSRVNLLLNASLFANTVLVIFSGAMASRMALPAIGLATSTNLAWGRIHAFLQHLMMVFLGLHMALNWERLKTVYGRMRAGTPAVGRL